MPESKTPGQKPEFHQQLEYEHNAVMRSIGFQESSSPIVTVSTREVKEETHLRSRQPQQIGVENAAEGAEKATEHASSISAPVALPASTEHQDDLGSRSSINIAAHAMVNQSFKSLGDQHGEKKHATSDADEGVQRLDSGCPAPSSNEEETALPKLEYPAKNPLPIGSRWRRSWRRPAASGSPAQKQVPVCQLHESYDDGWDSDATVAKKPNKVKQEPHHANLNQMPAQQASSRSAATVSTSATCVKEEIKPEKADDGSAQSWVCTFCTFVNDSPALKREGSCVAYTKRKRKSDTSKRCLRRLHACSMCGLHNLTMGTSQQDLDGLRVVELKALLRALNLSHSGKKKDLIARLVANSKTC